MERKVFNYESIILKELTLEKEGYDPDIFGSTSRKFLFAICRYCGKPHRIRKGFFIRSGSACHKECRIEEQKRQSPFSDPLTREKAKKTNLERYGTEIASKSKIISDKISQTRNTEECKNKIKQTNIIKYGVENVFQSEEIKEKIKKTNLEKYGVDHPQKSKEVKEKTLSTIQARYGVDNVMNDTGVKEKLFQTNIEKYGFKNPNQNIEIKNKSVKKFNQTIQYDPNDNYHLINTLRQDDFWNCLSSGESLKLVCEKFEINYQSVTSRLLDEEFSEKYYSLYSFPKTQLQKEIKDEIEKMGLKTTFNDRSIIYPFELDIYIPEKQFAIEVNGSYWHSEAILEPKEAKNKHKNKLDLCRQKNIRLFQIFENNWQKRKKQILNFIKSILGKNSFSVAARECVVTNDENVDFMNGSHIQGYGFGTIKWFNLINNGQIIASMTASKHHRQNVRGNPIVLNRLCFRDGYNVQGGSSRLFKYFREWAKNEKYDRIISWSDNCWTEGKIYEILGFVLSKEYYPDYFYWGVKKNIYLSKQSQKKSNTKCPKETTEREWCFNNKIYRIWDCGKKLWEYKL